MPRQIEKGDPGTERPILIDGIELDIMPANLDAPPEPLSDYLEHLSGGATECQRRPWFEGVSNHMDVYTYTFEYDQIKGDDRIKMEEIRVTGGLHRLTVWRMVPVKWSCTAGISRYYVPRFRRPAAHLYDGLMIGGAAGAVEINTENFPIDVTLNGEALTVTYAEGPDLADPGAGGVVFARQPDASGESMGYCALRLGDAVATGDALMAWGCWTHEGSLRSSSLSMRGQSETQGYTFVEA